MNRFRRGLSEGGGPAFLAALLAAAPAIANDSTAELGTGGLQLIRNDAVSLLSEDLYVSADAVRVAYRFLNTTAAPVTYLVAFPLPPIDAIVPEDMNIVLPEPASDNFVGFTVTVDGQPVTPQISARATVLGVDRTEALRSRGLPLNPLADGLYERLKALPPDEVAALNQLGLVTVDPYSIAADWRFEQSFYWQQTFLPGKEIRVEHSYRPVVGYSFFGKYSLKDDWYRKRYCLDADFDRSATRKLDAIAGSENPYLDELRISYILTTANNWAAPIKSFHLVVDKGTPDALVSFCASDVHKVDATTFEVKASDFTADKEMEILIVRPRKDQ
jgi:hypothetical protein